MPRPASGSSSSASPVSRWARGGSMTAAAGSGRPAYRRIVLKLSGEALAGNQSYGIDPLMLDRVASEVREVSELGVQIAIVIGGGNIFRGVAASAGGMDRATADYMGMLATVINALALQDALEKAGLQTRVLSAIEMRAVEIGADAIMKATKVDGVYSADPKQDATAQRFDRMTYIEVLNRGLQVMDAAAISLCMDNKLPIIVFDLTRSGNIKRIVLGEAVGSIVSSGG